MDSIGKKRVGRPRAFPQTGPLVLGTHQARAKIEIEVLESTLGELKEYARWVELCSNLGTGEALATTVEFALQETFRRDRLWQQKRRERTDKDPVPAMPNPPKASPGPSTLPPPISTRSGASPLPAGNSR